MASSTRRRRRTFIGHEMEVGRGKNNKTMEQHDTKTCTIFHFLFFFYYKLMLRGWISASNLVNPEESSLISVRRETCEGCQQKKRKNDLYCGWFVACQHEGALQEAGLCWPESPTQGDPHDRKVPCGCQTQRAGRLRTGVCLPLHHCFSRSF